MFLDFYRLREQPFGDTPDPRYLYLSRTHREALASLFCGIETGRGFLALIAEPGMGKTTLVFQLLERLQRSSHTVFLFQTQCDSRDLVRYLLSKLGVDTTGLDIVAMHDKLNEILARDMLAGRRFVLVVDEAHNLDKSVLETTRLLSNFETPQAKLLQIILSGQPQLAQKLASPSLVQLRQRISILGQLHPFNAADTARYIEHRLWVAGYDGAPLFSPSALEKIAASSQGIPRNINNLCFNALSLGCAAGQKRIHSAIVDEVMADLDLRKLAGGPRATQTQPITPPAQRKVLEYPKTKASGSRRRVVGSSAFVAALALVGLFAIALPEVFHRVLLDPLGGNPAQTTHASAVSRPATSETEPSPAAESRASEIPTAKPAAQENHSGEIFTILVRPHQTLRQICLQHVGRFDDSFVRKILELNPWLADPNRIEIGQEIRLPSERDASESRSAAFGAQGKSEATQTKGHE